MQSLVRIYVYVPKSRVIVQGIHHGTRSDSHLRLYHLHTWVHITWLRSLKEHKIFAQTLNYLCTLPIKQRIYPATAHHSHAPLQHQYVERTIPSASRRTASIQTTTYPQQKVPRNIQCKHLPSRPRRRYPHAIQLGPFLHQHLLQLHAMPRNSFARTRAHVAEPTRFPRDNQVRLSGRAERRSSVSRGEEAGG